MDEAQAGHDESGIVLPTLASFLRSLRERRRMGQKDLADAVGVSLSYLQKLERGERGRGSREVTGLLADALRLEGADRQMLFYLGGQDPVPVLAGPGQLRAGLTPRQRSELGEAEPDYMGYFDPRWNLLICNTPMDYGFPGLAEAGNLLVWCFAAPEAKQVLLQWRHEAQLNVALVRGLLARYHPAPWSGPFIAQLSAFPEFVALWNSSDRPAYGRPEDDPLMHMLDPVTGEPYSLHVEMCPVPSHGHEVYRFVGVREPEFVPPLRSPGSPPGTGG